MGGSAFLKAFHIFGVVKLHVVPCNAPKTSKKPFKKHSLSDLLANLPVINKHVPNNSYLSPPDPTHWSCLA